MATLSNSVFNEARWRPRGSTGIRERKSVENRIRCLANFKFSTQTTGLLTNTTCLQVIFSVGHPQTYWSLFTPLRYVARERLSFCSGRFTRHDFCLRLSRVIFIVHAACVMWITVPIEHFYKLQELQCYKPRTNLRKRKKITAGAVDRRRSRMKIETIQV